MARNAKTVGMPEIIAVHTAFAVNLSNCIPNTFGTISLYVICDNKTVDDLIAFFSSNHITGKNIP